jgi:hypothetical protein
MKLLVVQFAAPSYSFVPLGSKYSQHPVLKHSSLFEMMSPESKSVRLICFSLKKHGFLRHSQTLEPTYVAVHQMITSNLTIGKTAFFLKFGNGGRILEPQSDPHEGQVTDVNKVQI